MSPNQLTQLPKSGFRVLDKVGRSIAVGNVGRRLDGHPHFMFDIGKVKSAVAHAPTGRRTISKEVE